MESNDESSDTYDDEIIMLPLLSIEETSVLDSVDDPDDEPMSMKMSEGIRDGSHSNPNVNTREVGYKIRDHINQIQLGWKGALKSAQNMDKGSHKVFKNVVK